MMNERSGAQGNLVSKRYRINDPELASVLSKIELQAIQKAKETGVKGTLVIGIQDGKALLPQFIPQQPAEENTINCDNIRRQLGVEQILYIEL